MDAYAVEAAEYADSQRIAYALVRSMRERNNRQTALILDGVPHKKLHQMCIVLAGLSSNFVTDAQIDNLLARSLDGQLSGDYESFFRDLGAPGGLL